MSPEWCANVARIFCELSHMVLKYVARISHDFCTIPLCHLFCYSWPGLIMHNAGKLRPENQKREWSFICPQNWSLPSRPCTLSLGILNSYMSCWCRVAHKTVGQVIHDHYHEEHSNFQKQKRSGRRWRRVSQSNGTSITALAEWIANM
jgi:hypothetical protein